MRARDTCGDRGSVTAWMMVVPVLVLLLGGVAMDGWHLLSVRSRLAAGVDDAAAAGAGMLDPASLRAGTPQLDPAAAITRSLEAVDGHPDLDHVVARDAVADAQRIEVTVDAEVPLLLLRLTGVEQVSVSVTGAAGVSRR